MSLSVVEDQVKYLRSLGIQAAYIGKNKTKNGEMLNEVGAFSLLYGSPESLTGDKKFRAMFSRRNSVAVVCDEVTYIQLFIGKYAHLFSRKGATLNLLWGALKG